VTKHVGQPRFRKFAPIDREYPIFELLDGDEVLLDIGADNDGVVEVAIHGGAADKLFGYRQLLDLLKQGHELLREEMEE
jgi:hypothetical protein